MELTRRQALAAMGGSALLLAVPALGGVALAEADGARNTGGDRRPRGVVGYLYVNDNTAGMNTVAGFARAADGTLTPLAGSPFAIGGAGTGKGVGSQGAVQLAHGGRYLLVADAGSNAIAVLRVRRDGSIRPVEGSPVSSGGVKPVSIAVHGELVYVANSGDASGGANYTGFILNGGGHLRPLAGSAIPLPAGSSLGDVLFSGDGRHLAGMRVATSLIDSFVVGADGKLTAAPGSPFAAQGFGPLGSAFRPTNPSQLYVSNAHNAQGGPGAGTVSAFQVAADGTLRSIGTSPYPDQQIAPCWLVITPDGRRLFVANTASDSISRYTINQDGTLTLLGSTTLRGAPGVGVVELRLDRGGRLLYALESARGAVATLRNDDGALTELAASPVALPSGATPFGMAVR